MLPFLKRKDGQASGIIIKNREPDQPSESPQENPDSHLACAADLLSAIERKDVKGIAQALSDAMCIMESEPKEDAPSPHSYEAQNIKASNED